MKEKTIFGQRLRHLRQEAGLSKKKLADKLGMTDNRYENDLREPEFATLPWITRFLKCLWIIYWELKMKMSSFE